MYKNVTSQKIAVFAWDAALGVPKTGDAANITAQISKDGAAMAAVADTNPTELDATNAPGVYVFDLAQAETNADLIVIAAKSSTSNITIRPLIIHPTLLDATKAGYLDASINTVDGIVDAIKAKTDNLPSDPADQSAVEAAITAATSPLATAASLATVAGYIDTEVAAIQAKTNLIPASPAATGDIPSAAAVASQVRAELTTELGRLDAAISTRASQSSLDTVDGLADAILEDTGTTLPAAIADVPTVAEFEARSIPSADYTIVSDLGVVQTADHTAAIADLPTNAELASALASADDAVLAAISALENLSSAGAQAAAAAALTAYGAALEANAQGHAADALTAYDPPTRAEATSDKAAIQADIAALSLVTVADILAGVVEGSITLQQSLRAVLAFVAGKATGGGTTVPAFRDQADTKNRITMTVDEGGNRSAVALDLT